jgi:hypothetical protein
MTNHQYFAQLNADNVVMHVAVVHRDFLEANPNRYPGTWVETFVNLPNKTYAGVGFIYNYETQDFTPPPVIDPSPKPLPEA